MESVFGAYGKIPVLGDFFRIGLPPGFTQPWDLWLQGMMQAGRAVLGGRWQDCYFSAPIWRFTLAAGVVGPWSVQGVLMPSVDRVGREFPLTLAVMLPPLGSALHSHLAAAATLAAMEDLALDALEDGMTRETLAGRLAALPRPARPAVRDAVVSHDADHVALALPMDSPQSGILAAPQLHRPAIWSASLAGRELLIAANTLLAPRQALLLFDPGSGFHLPPSEDLSL